jgi:uncharacterized membrane protein
MKERIKQIQHRMEHDPKFKEAVTRIKPKKNFWGIAGIFLFFFVPELVTYIWYDELITWAHLHSITEPIASQRWMFGKMEEMFASGVSWVNLTLGSLFLLWVLKSK